MAPSALAEIQQKEAYKQWLQRVEALLPTGKEGRRVTAEITAKGGKENLNYRFLKKRACYCTQHVGDDRYQRFRKTGPVVVARCFSLCPFCDYSPGAGKTAIGIPDGVHCGGTIRKHIMKRHCGNKDLEGLWVVSDKVISEHGLLDSLEVLDSDDEETPHGPQSRSTLDNQERPATVDKAVQTTGQKACARKSINIREWLSNEGCTNTRRSEIVGMECRRRKAVHLKEEAPEDGAIYQEED